MTKKTTPAKAQTTTIQDWDGADEHLKFISIVNQKMNKQIADMNLAITKIQEQYKGSIESLEAEKIGLETNLALFCKEHRSEFSEKKSKELHYGIVSFRNSTPSLKTLKGITWEAVKMLIQKSKKFSDLFIRTKVDIDKSAILSSNLPPAELAKLGVTIQQEENFSYECFERN